MNAVRTPAGTLEPARSRATALPPEERRARIVEATLPLLLAHGTALTTRQIAEAAGIAEGTIFRVFPDKESLIAAVVEAALDTTSVDAQFDAIDATLPLDERLIAAVEILRRRMADVLQLRAAVGILDQRPSADLGALAAVFEPDRAALRRDPVQAAHLLRGLTLAGTHPSLAPEEPLTSEEIVSLLLDGLRRPGGEDALMDLLRLLRTYLLRYRRLLTIVVALTFVQVMCTLYLPTLNADIIDKGVITGDTDYIWRTGGLMLVITFVQAGFAIAAVYFGARAAMAFGRDVRGALFHRVTDFSAQDVATFGSASLITRITNDVTQVQTLVVMVCTLFVAAPITIVGGSIMAVREDGPLSLLLLVSVPALIVSVGLVIVRMLPQFQKMQERIDRINEVMREQITGLRVVRAFVHEPNETARFGAANADLTETSLKAGRLMAFMFPTVMLILNVSSAAAIWIGGNRIGAGEMQIGALIAFLSYLIQILMSVMLATFVAVMAPRASVSAERIQDVLGSEPSIAAPPNPVTELGRDSSLELRDVSFEYPGAEHPVLCDISFRVAAGETTAIIGSTGSGKSTLLNLVPRLFDATDGSVLVDGVDVRDLDLELLWSRIGLVPQKPFLFSGTVATNLRHANPDATDDELWAALEIAQARDFVAAMPGGLDARIAEGGSNVSGGQRQRLAIARALVRRPGIYLFDDSFSALDLATDARLRAALAPVVRAAVTVIVAQRVSTIRHADQIIVLEDGVIVGKGRHEDLLDHCETYQEIVASQLTAEEAA